MEEEYEIEEDQTHGQSNEQVELQRMNLKQLKNQGMYKSDKRRYLKANLMEDIQGWNIET
jgi:hypothetical protein